MLCYIPGLLDTRAITPFRLSEVNSAHCLKGQFHHVTHKDIAGAGCEALAWGLLQVSLQQDRLTMLVDLLSIVPAV
jgi:hypothetical protein